MQVKLIVVVVVVVTSLLQEEGYVNQIKTVIKVVQEDYQKDKFVKTTLIWKIIRLKVREQNICLG